VDIRSLKTTTDYLFQLYNFKNIPLQYLPQVELYAKKVRHVKIKLNTYDKGKATCTKDFSVYRPFRKTQ